MSAGEHDLSMIQHDLSVIQHDPSMAQHDLSIIQHDLSPECSRSPPLLAGAAMETGDEYAAFVLGNFASDRPSQLVPRAYNVTMKATAAACGGGWGCRIVNTALYGHCTVLQGDDPMKACTPGAATAAARSATWLCQPLCRASTKV